MQNYQDPYNPLNGFVQQSVVDSFSPPPGIGAQPIIPPYVEHSSEGGRFQRLMNKLASSNPNKSHSHHGMRHNEALSSHNSFSSNSSSGFHGIGGFFSGGDSTGCDSGGSDSGGSCDGGSGGCDGGSN